MLIIHVHIFVIVIMPPVTAQQEKLGRTILDRANVELSWFEIYASRRFLVLLRARVTKPGGAEEIHSSQETILCLNQTSIQPGELHPTCEGRELVKINSHKE